MPLVEPSRLYLQHIDAMNRIASSLCRRNGVLGDDAEDFASEVRLRLLEDDYAVIRKHRGDSSITTFLTVVNRHLTPDYHIRMEGKCRPSAEARKRGETAVHLETPTHRNGLSPDEACPWLDQPARRETHRKSLREMIQKQPRRTP